MSHPRPGPAGPRRRTWPGWVLAITTVVLAASTVHPLWLGLSERAPWAQLVQLRVLSAALALTGAVVLGAIAVRITAARRRPVRTATVAVALLLVAGAHGGVLLARGALGEQQEVMAREGDLTMLALNVEGDGAASADVVALAQRSEADVLALSEVRPARGRAIGAALGAGGPAWTVLCAATDRPTPEPANRYSLLPYVEAATCLVVSPGLGRYEVAGPQPDLLGGGVVAMPVPGRGEVPDGSPDGDDVGGPPTADLAGTRARPPLAALHTTPPIPLVFGMERWRDEVAVAVAVCESLDGAVVGGDLNVTQDAAGMRGADRCTDTASGAPASGTWPSSLPSGVASRIDHVLADARAWSVVGTRVEEVADTDHRAVVAVLRPR